MTGAQGIIVYFVCWWLLLFMALPIGVRTEENPQAGEDTGAPKKTYLAVKCASVTVLALLVTWAINVLIHSGLIVVK